MKVSNNSLVILLSIVIVVSVAGTFFSLNFIDDSITGAATTTGNVTLTIGSTANCEATDALIAFGSLAQSASNQSEVAGPDFIVINNTGNVNINITAVATVDLFSSVSAPSVYWMIHCNSSSTGTCNTTYHNIGSSATLIVSALEFADGSDNATIGINVTIPGDEPIGSKNGEITFTCTQA